MPKPKLHYCNTIYKYQPIQDINPLIIQKYFSGQLLVLCSKEEQADRINSWFTHPDFPYKDMVLLACNWWDAEKLGLTKQNKFLQDELRSYDAVVILNRLELKGSHLGMAEQIEKIIKKMKPDPPIPPSKDNFIVS